MPIKPIEGGGLVATGRGVDVFRLVSVKHQLKMEKVGMKSSGGPLRPRLAKEFGLKPRDPHDKYIAKVEELIEQARAADGTYRIVRNYFSDDKPSEVVARGLTLEEAQGHCRSPETNSRTCTLPENQKITAEHGQWFDGYEKE